MSNERGSWENIILEGPNNVTLEQALKFGFMASNNQAEYEALIAGLKLAKKVGARKLRCYSNSQLVHGQVANRYQDKEAAILRYYHAIKTLVDDFDCFKMYHIPREDNTTTDLLSKIASTKKTGHLKTIIHETLQAPMIDINEVMAGEEEEPDWMTPYKNFLTQGVLPSNKNEARRLKRKASYYVILDGELFKRGLTTTLFKCLESQQADYVI